MNKGQAKKLLRKNNPELYKQLKENGTLKERARQVVCAFEIGVNRERTRCEAILKAGAGLPARELRFIIESGVSTETAMPMLLHAAMCPDSLSIVQ
jgi:hypothetical protein